MNKSREIVSIAEGSPAIVEKRPGFSVTYERWDEEALEVGDTDDRGYVVRDVSLRAAIAETGRHAAEADEWPIYTPRGFYWFGVQEDRALHIPDWVTDSSRRRIARVLGLKTTR